MSEDDRDGRTFYERDPTKSYLNHHDPANIIPGDVRLRSQRNTTPFPEVQPIRKLSLPRDFGSGLDSDPAVVEVNEIATVAKDLDELTTADIWKHIDGVGTTNLDELRQLWNDAMEEPVVGHQLAHLRELNPDHVAKYLRQRQWSLESAGLQDGRMSMAFGRNAETEAGSVEGQRTSGAQYDLAIHPEISRFGRLQTIYERNGETLPSYLGLPPVNSPEFHARLSEFRQNIERRKSRGHPPPGTTSEGDARMTEPTVDARTEPPEVIDVEKDENQKNAGVPPEQAETVVFKAGTAPKPPEEQTMAAKTSEVSAPVPTTAATDGQDQNLLVLIVQQLADAKTRAQDLHDQIEAKNDTITNRIDTNSQLLTDRINANNQALTDRIETNKQAVTGQIESNRRMLKNQLDAHGEKITKQFETVTGRVDTVVNQVETLQDEVRHNQDQAQSTADRLRQEMDTVHRDQNVFDQNVRTLADDLRTMRGELRKLTHGQTTIRQTDAELHHRYEPAVDEEHRSYQKEREEVEAELPKPTRSARTTPLPSAPIAALAQERPPTNLLHLRTELTRQTGPFNPKAENVPGGFQTFEIKFRDMAEDLELPPSEWVKVLKTTLKGEAYTEYHAMPEHLKLDFNAVCQRLRTIYPTQPKNQMASRQDWAKLRQGNRQSIAEFVGKIAVGHQRSRSSQPTGAVSNVAKDYLSVTESRPPPRREKQTKTFRISLPTGTVAATTPTGSGKTKKQKPVSGGKVIECKVCGANVKEPVEASYLVDHVRIHLPCGASLYSCDTCGFDSDRLTPTLQHGRSAPSHHIRANCTAIWAQLAREFANCSQDTEFPSSILERWKDDERWLRRALPPVVSVSGFAISTASSTSSQPRCTLQSTEAILASLDMPTADSVPRSTKPKETVDSADNISLEGSATTSTNDLEPTKSATTTQKSTTVNDVSSTTDATKGKDVAAKMTSEEHTGRSLEGKERVSKELDPWVACHVCFEDVRNVYYGKKRHVWQKHMRKVFVCTTCSKEYAFPEAARAHAKSVHGGTETIIDNRGVLMPMFNITLEKCFPSGSPRPAVLVSPLRKRRCRKNSDSASKQDGEDENPAKQPSAKRRKLATDGSAASTKAEGVELSVPGPSVSGNASPASIFNSPPRISELEVESDEYDSIKLFSPPRGGTKTDSPVRSRSESKTKVRETSQICEKGSSVVSCPKMKVHVYQHINELIAVFKCNVKSCNFTTHGKGFLDDHMKHRHPGHPKSDFTDNSKEAAKLFPDIRLVCFPKVLSNEVKEANKLILSEPKSAQSSPGRPTSIFCTLCKLKVDAGSGDASEIYWTLPGHAKLHMTTVDTLSCKNRGFECMDAVVMEGHSEKIHDRKDGWKKRSWTTASRSPCPWSPESRSSRRTF